MKQDEQKSYKSVLCHSLDRNRLVAIAVVLTTFLKLDS